MADFKNSSCCSCGENKSCSDAFANFSSELCPKSPAKAKQDKVK